MDSSNIAKLNNSQNISKNFEFESLREIEIEFESQSYIEKNESKNYFSTSPNDSKENEFIEIKDENEEEEKKKKKKKKKKK